MVISRLSHFDTPVFIRPFPVYMLYAPGLGRHLCVILKMSGTRWDDGAITKSLMSSFLSGMLYRTQILTKRNTLSQPSAFCFQQTQFNPIIFLFFVLCNLI